MILKEMAAGGDSKGVPLFSGYPEEIRLYRVGGYQEAEITVLSGTTFFQYRETDWEFLRRVSSRLGLPLVADSGYHYPRFYMGLRRGDVKEIPKGSSRALSFDGDRFYRMREQGMDVAREDFFCYHVTTWINLGLGECAGIGGRELSVSRKEMVLQDGGGVFHYVLAGFIPASNESSAVKQHKAMLHGLTNAARVKCFRCRKNGSCKI